MTSRATMNPERTARPRRRDEPATLAVLAFSVAVAVGFARVFPGWGFLPDMVLITVVGHGLSFGLRRVGLSGWLAIPLLAAALAWLTLWIHYGSTFAWMLPATDTFTLARLELEVVREQFSTTTAPVEYGAGWALLATASVALVVLLADTFAFRADARAETLVPGGVLYVFVGALGDERLRVGLTALLVAVGVVTVVVLRAYHDTARRPALRPARGRRDLAVPATVATALAVAVAAGVIGPRIPGAGAEPLLDTRGRSGVTEVLSPLVDIRARLVRQSDSELFRVAADEPAYWRLTTLPEFDGDTFRLPTRPLERIDGALGTTVTDGEQRRQDIEIVRMGGQLVPAAAEPVEASGGSIRWNPDTATLVNVDGDLTAGDTFTVVSVSNRLQPSELRAATSSTPPDPVHLTLPGSFPDSVHALAAELTADASTAYDTALALQDFFRTEFEYSLDVPTGHGASAIEVFLRQRIGYCEQFAATFAAMARSVGLPSRVAVGYTAGLRADDGRFSVLGRNAHAWPEVWFDGIGWVPFEPTPGRGAPGTEQYTGVAPAQDETPAGGGPNGEGDDPVAGPDAGGASEPPTGPELSPDGPQLDDFDLMFPDPSAGQSGGPSAQADPGGTPWGWYVAAGLVVLLLVPAVGRRLVQQRRRHATDPAHIRAAWDRARRSVRAAGVELHPSMTVEQVAMATADSLPVAARPMRSLAETMSAVTFAPPGSFDLGRQGRHGETLARNCTIWASQVDAIAADQLTPGGRVRRYAEFWR